MFIVIMFPCRYLLLKFINNRCLEHERTQRQPVSRAHIVVNDHHPHHASVVTTARGLDHGHRAPNTWAGYLALIDPETY